MAKEDDAASKRILYIEERQAALIRAAGSLQGSLLARLTAAVAAIQKSPDSAIDAVFDAFNRDEAAKVVGQFAKDIVGIGKLNAEYFSAVADLSPKDYREIQSTAEDYLLKRFGLGRNGKPVRNGFLESFITDPTVRRSVKQYAYKTKGSGAGLGDFTKGLGDLLKTGDGPIVKYYKTYALDTYQQADREIQEQAADRLGMSTFIYAGGLIKSSRPFCISRNGKVFTRDEALAWKDLSFDGKPTNYDPLRDLGGYGCRHHKNYITDAMAIRRRPELADVLKPSGGAKEEEAPKEEAPTDGEFRPAKSLSEAKQFARDNGIAKNFGWGDEKADDDGWGDIAPQVQAPASLESVNATNEELLRLHKKYKLPPADFLNIEVLSAKDNASGYYGPFQTKGSNIQDGYILGYNREVFTEADIIRNQKIAKRYAKPDGSYEEVKAKFEKHKAKYKQMKNAPDNKVRGKYFQEYGRLEIEVQRAKYAPIADRWTVGADHPGPNSTIIHEYGHALHNHYFGMYEDRKRHPTKRPDLFSDAEAKALDGEIRSLYAEMQKDKSTFKISDYGATNHKEFFAESFTMYELEPGKLPKKVKTLLDKLLNYAKQ